MEVTPQQIRNFSQTMVITALHLGVFCSRFSGGLGEIENQFDHDKFPLTHTRKTEQERNTLGLV